MARVVVTSFLLCAFQPPALAQSGASSPPGGTAGVVVTNSKVFALKLVDGKLVGSPDTLRVQQGDHVELRFTSNLPMSLHVHGYDLSIPLQRDVPAVSSFTARLPGRFPVSDHGAGKTQERALLYFEVLP